MADAGATLAAVGDPTATRTVYVTVGMLAALGVAMALLAVWVFRRTRPEPELLAPLEAMESRNWRRVDPATQRRLLDDARPTGAAPLKRQALVPKLDSDFSTVAPVTSFADLVDDESGEGKQGKGEPTSSTPVFDVLTSGLAVDDGLAHSDVAQNDVGLPEDLGERQPDGALGIDGVDTDALEIDDAVAAFRQHDDAPDQFDDDGVAEELDEEFEFGDTGKSESGNNGFAEDFAPEFGDDPLIARQRSSDGDRS